MKKLLLLFLTIILITGCSKKEEVQKREVKTQHLSCSSSTIDNGVRNNIKINISYSNNKIIDGKIRYELILPIDSSIEEKEMLNTLSMCSTDIMTNLIEYGKCTSKVKDNKLISILRIDKEKINNYDKSIKEIKDELETNINLNCNCKIY